MLLPVSWIRVPQSLMIGPTAFLTLSKVVCYQINSTTFWLLRASLIMVFKLFLGHLNLAAEEFFDAPVAGNIQGHNFKVRQPRFSSWQAESGFCSTFGRAVKWTASIHRWSFDSVQLQGCQLVFYLPWHCLALPHSLFLYEWCYYMQVLFLVP